MGRVIKLFLVLTGAWIVFACGEKKPDYDLIIRHGMIYDGLGGNPIAGDVAIQADTLVAMGDLSERKGVTEIDATGLAVAPGFINMLSWADGSLLKDGRSMSDLKQGVTLEVFGEGWSPGPRRKKNANDSLWTSLGEYFGVLEKKGVSTNFASFVGATTVRNYVLGFENKKPNASELARMKQLVDEAMRQGAMGLGSSLIYAPADYADTNELIELCKVIARYDGMYITHMRSESDKIYSALNEVFTISQEANVPTEIYHLKINNTWNWNKVDTVIAKIDSAQKAGLKITANMYTYHASGTSLTARLPTWVQAGGAPAMRKRLRNPITRKKLLEELRLGIPTKNSDPTDVMIIGFRKDSLNKLYRGKRLSEIAALHGKNANETMLDLIISDKSGIAAIFFLISEENVKKMLALPFVSICSDASSIPAEEPFIKEATHPRAYGSFARLLGKYVREEHVMSLQEAIRRLTSLPASNLKLKKRGSLQVGNYADVVIFDPANVKDNATFDQPHQYADGMVHVFVNGAQVLDHGNHTGLTPGRCVRGSGYLKQ
ncbi:MAG: D-aminoacylase [Cyclobacteriaceae bacterium]|nr:D-aminoacylase [Cyclobacteriaceae bacterium]